jgi:hypothetical protein
MLLSRANNAGAIGSSSQQLWHPHRPYADLADTVADASSDAAPRMRRGSSICDPSEEDDEIALAAKNTGRMFASLVGWLERRVGQEDREELIGQLGGLDSAIAQLIGLAVGGDGGNSGGGYAAGRHDHDVEPSQRLRQWPRREEWLPSRDTEGYKHLGSFRICLCGSSASVVASLLVPTERTCACGCGRW